MFAPNNVISIRSIANFMWYFPKNRNVKVIVKIATISTIYIATYIYIYSNWNIFFCVFNCKLSQSPFMVKSDCESEFKKTLHVCEFPNLSRISTNTVESRISVYVL